MRRLVFMLGCLLFLTLAACSKPPAFDNTDLTGNTVLGTDFSLPDTNGKIRTLADYRGKVVILFFGYTHCPDVCPTTLAELTQTMQMLGNDAQRVQVLFVTVDPQRDTASTLAQYVSAFNPSFVGLRPTDAAQLQKVTSDFKIYAAKDAGSSPTDYTIDHTAASYVFDTDGKLRLFVPDAQGTAPWVHDLKLLLG